MVAVVHWEWLRVVVVSRRYLLIFCRRCSVFVVRKSAPDTCSWRSEVWGCLNWSDWSHFIQFLPEIQIYNPLSQWRPRDWFNPQMIKHCSSRASSDSILIKTVLFTLNQKSTCPNHLFSCFTLIFDFHIGFSTYIDRVTLSWGALRTRNSSLFIQSITSILTTTHQIH